MKLFISGKGKAFLRSNLTPTQERLKKLLDSSKDGELFTARQLATMMKVNFATVTHDCQHALVGYSHLVTRTRYWGKPSTIKQLIKETS